MASTYVIGQEFLTNYESSYYITRRIIFHGSVYLGNGNWRVTLSKEITNMNYSVAYSTTFRLEIKTGDVIRFSNYHVYIGKNNEITMQRPIIISNKFRDVKSVRFINVGQDFITVEYNFQ